MKIILKARVGSHLYGLETPESDEDFLGVYVAPTWDVLSLHSKPQETIVSKDPDTTMHELEKYMRLAAQGNPTVLELLFCPTYEVCDYYAGGEMLLEGREYFLSNRVRDTYGGYAYQQAKKLDLRISQGLEGFGPELKKRYAKHARHIFRLMMQGEELLTTGIITPRLEDPQALFEVGELPPEKLIPLFQRTYARFRELPTILPDQPNWDALDTIINGIRRYNT
jgi:predicted nucleotidyltransferase